MINTSYVVVIDDTDEIIDIDAELKVMEKEMKI